MPDDARPVPAADAAPLYAPRPVAGIAHGIAGRFFVLLYHVLQGPARAMLTLVRRWPKLYRTFFGSDIYNRYTAVYSWCADQTGHMMVGAFAGCIGGVLAFRALPYLTGADAAWQNAVWFGIVGLFWLGYVSKEVADAIVAVEPDATDGIRRIAPFFGVDALELGMDAADDSLFVLLGACLAFWPMAGNPWVWLAFPLLPLILWLGWRVFKALGPFARFDASGVPDYTRLHNYRREVTRLPDTAPMPPEMPMPEAVRRFVVCEAGAHRTVVISGAPGAVGRTALANAIACEMMVKGSMVRYTTQRLLREQRWQEDDRLLLVPGLADVIVVDDVLLEGPDTLRATADAVVAQHQRQPPCMMILVAVGPRSEDAAQVVAASSGIPKTCGPVLDLRVLARPRVDYAVAEPPRPRNHATKQGLGPAA